MLRLSFAGLTACVDLLAPTTIGLAHAEPPSVVLASTTLVEDTGLLDAILTEFTNASGIGVRVIALGTGRALDAAQHGDADLVLVHDPEAEEKFVREGDGVGRRQIAWNDFVIVGPGEDPAHIKGGHDAVTAFIAIGKAKATFVSRGDRSAEAPLMPSNFGCGKPPESTRRAASGAGIAILMCGMERALDNAAAMPAYTLCDRGTWLSFKNKEPLTIDVEGDARLINRFDVIELNPATHAKATLNEAHRFASWLASPEGQAVIGAYRINDEQLFHPSALDPK